MAIKKNVATRSITVISNKLDEKGNFKEIKVLIPNNVVSAEYFALSVQYHCFSLYEIDFTNKIIQNENNKDFEEDEDNVYFAKVEDLRLAKSTMIALAKTWQTNLADIVEDVESALNTFENDSFAYAFALTITGVKCEKVLSGDGKIETIDFRFNGHETICQEDVKALVCDLKYKNTLTKDYSKNLVSKINEFANANFSTNGGSLYKNIHFDFSIDTLVDEVYSRSKVAFKHDTNGKGISNRTVKPFEIAMTLLFLCLHTQGIPFVDGSKTQRYYNVGVKSTENLTFSFKK